MNYLVRLGLLTVTCGAVSAILVVAFWPEVWSLYREVNPGPYVLSYPWSGVVHGVKMACTMDVDKSGNGFLNNCSQVR